MKTSSPPFLSPGGHKLRAGSLLEVALQVEGERVQVGLAEPDGLHPPLLLPVLHLQVHPQPGREGNHC